VLEQVGVTAEAALTKARLVALIALCAGGSHKEVSLLLCLHVWVQQGGNGAWLLLCTLCRRVQCRA